MPESNEVFKLYYGESDLLIISDVWYGALEYPIYINRKH